MTSTEQQLIFCDTLENRLERKVDDLEEACDRVRKSQFAKISKLTKEYSELRHDLDTIILAMGRSSQK